VVGFSTGGALSLLLSAAKPEQVDAVVSICAPIEFRNKNMRFVPIMHGANRVVRWLSKYEGLIPFRQNESEHPHINYRNMPIRSLYELTRLVAYLKDQLEHVSCPTCIIQSATDRVVDPVSATIAFDLVGSPDKEIHWIESERHGILNEDIGGTHSLLLDFIERAAARNTQAHTDPVNHRTDSYA
jgi:esterase/lipase